MSKHNTGFTKRLEMMIVFLFLVTFLHASGIKASQLPHLVIYLSDDLGCSDISVYGSQEIKTPNIEALAKSGITFDQAFVASPSCAPSRAALLTGLMPARNGAEANHSYPKPGVPFLTGELKKLGYKILAFGKVAHSENKPEYQFDYCSTKAEDLSLDVVTYFKNHPVQEQPICLLLGDKRPHVPWNPTSLFTPDQVAIPSYMIDTRETRLDRALYLSEIKRLDNELGEIREITQKILGDNHIFVFSSDHGAQWPFGKWNLYDAGIKVPLIMAWNNTIQANTRTSALVSWVDIIPTLLDLTGGTYNKSIDGGSFAKVVLNKKNKHRDYIFTTQSNDGRMNMYPMRSIRSGQYKLIVNLCPDCIHTNHSDILRKENAGFYWNSWIELAKTDQHAARVLEKYFVRPAEEFYDVLNDPLEQNNLIGEAAHQKRIAAMRKKLGKWMTKQQDTKTIPENPYLKTDPYPIYKGK